MKFVHKIFAAIFLTAMSIVTVAVMSLSLVFEREQLRSFTSRYEALTESLAHTLVQAEKNTDILMKNAALVVQAKDAQNSNLTTQDLKSLAVLTGVTHVFLIDASGKFFRSTNEDPSLIPNLFSFSEKYRGLISGASTLEKTPIIPPRPEPTPFKFVLVPSLKKDRIIELGMRVEFISETLQQALAGDPEVTKISLFAPSGVSLGTVGRSTIPESAEANPVFDSNASRGIVRDDATEMTLATKIVADKGSNAENLSIANGYFYILSATVSKDALLRDRVHMRKVLALVTIGGFLISLLSAIFLSGRLVSKLNLMTSKLNRAFSAADLEMDLKIVGKDELGQLSNAFDSMASRLRSNQDKLLSAQRAEAIAQMTQMLAHDVRKPFSLLRMGLTMLGNAKDPAGVKQVLSRIVPEIDKAVRSVDGMIADVMEVGSPSTTLIQEAVSAESLIEATLGELIRMYPKSNISFTYDLKHVHMANVHVQKVGRVFSNIVGNAFQAMRLNGAMWFKTVESDGMIRFCVGNSGSVIPEESLKHLFDAFFTSGKKGGTGLGLAIAQKVVTAHGGKIWCESNKTAEHPEGKVEFYFTLPVATSRMNQSTANLPKHSADVAKLLVMFTEQSEPSLSVDKGELALEDDVLSSHAELGRPLRVLVIDDEGIYRGALASFLTRTPELEGALQLTLADGSESALEASGKIDFDLIITDVDMGSGSLDGFELVRELRRLGSKSLICVHSNRIVAADNKTAIEAGADNFLPKPMARAQFLRVLLQAAESAKARLSMCEVGAAVPAAVGHVKIKPGVLVVDDNEVVLLGWESELALDCEFHRMTSFEEVQEKLAVEPDFLKTLSYVVTDMHLDGSYGDGLDVGRLIKSLRSDLPVLLSSDDTFSDSELTGAVDKMIAKMPVGLSRLSQWRTNL